MIPAAQQYANSKRQITMDMRATPCLPPLLAYGEFPAAVERLLQQHLPLHDWQTAQADAALRQQVQGLITRSNYQITADIMAQLPALRLVATNGVGYDGIDLDYARSHGITVTNTPGVLDDAVAELAIALLLGLLRHIPQADAHVRSGQWTQGALPLGTSLAGKKVGIVGLGRIGMEIAQRLAPFKVALGYFGRQAQSSVAWPFFDRLTALAEWADVLVLSCPGGAATAGIINAEVLAALGPQGYLINVARGTVVHEPDLEQALLTRTIAGAALDVYAQEPLAENSRLKNCPNALLTPHMASATIETRLRMAQLVIDNAKQFFANGKALTPVV